MKTYFEQGDRVLNAQLLVILIVELAQQRGVHTDKLLKGTKMFRQDLTLANFTLSHAQFVRLIENTIKLLPQADTPFLIGSRIFPDYSGDAGKALLYSTSLVSIFRVARVLQTMLFPYQFMRAIGAGNHQYLLFNQAISMEKLPYRRFMTELLVSLLVSIAKHRQIPLQSVEVRFPYAKPQHFEQYQVYYPFKYYFSPSPKEMLAPLQIKFARNLMYHPLLNSHKILAQHSMKRLEVSDNKIGFLHFIMTIVHKRLIRQADISLEWLAETLYISPATLKRRLSCHGISYQQLIDLIRQQHAVFLLTEQGLTNEKVATELNYSDLTNFRRSFKRWTGLTPSHFQQAYL